MSADNTVLILKTDGPEWRVAHVQNSEDSDQPKYIRHYYSKADVFHDEDSAWKYARRLADQIMREGPLEYGIGETYFPGKFIEIIRRDRGE